MVGRPNEKVSVPKCMMESQSYGTPKIVYPGNISSLICSPCCWMNWSRIKRIAGLAKKTSWQLLTIILALVTNVIGVFEFVFDVLFKNTDMPEKYELDFCQTLISDLIFYLSLSALFWVCITWTSKVLSFLNRCCWGWWFVGSWC